MIAGTVLTFSLYIGFVFLVPFIEIGTVAPDWVAVNAALHVLPPLLGMLYLMGAFAAGVTTANTQFLTCAQGLARDLYQKLINPEASEQQVMRITYAGIIIVAVASAVMAAFKPWLLVIAGTITGMILAFGYFPAIVLGLFWDKLTAKAVEITLWISVPLGIFAVYTWTNYKWFQPHPTIWGAVIGFGMMIILSFVTKKTPKEVEAWAKIKPIMWPKQPTILIDSKDTTFIVTSSIFTAVIGVAVIGVYLGWFW